MTRYELLDRIGVGGMAEIFRGKAVAAGGFEKPVAIKRILTHLSQDKRFVELLIAEAKVLSLLKHRNIVQIFDVGLGDDNKYFLVMEYVDGKDLGAIQAGLEARRARMPLDLALHIGAEICEALEHAHTARAPDGKPMTLVHRDVSPSNVLLSRAGEVKLTDFGIAKRAEQETQHGAVRGKFAYISPEQARNEQIEPRSDVFAVGILLWELLASRRLFSGQGDLEALRAVREAQVPRLADVNPRIAPDIEKLVMAALSREPRNRPTAGQLGAKLRSLRYAIEVTAGDPATELAKIIDAADQVQRESKQMVAQQLPRMSATPGTGFDPIDHTEATVIRIRTADDFSIPDKSAGMAKARSVIEAFEEEETRLAQISDDQLKLLRSRRDGHTAPPPRSPGISGPARGRRPTDEPTVAHPPIDPDSGEHMPTGSGFGADESTRLLIPSRDRRTPLPDRMPRPATVPPPMPARGASPLQRPNTRAADQSGSRQPMPGAAPSPAPQHEQPTMVAGPLGFPPPQPVILPQQGMQMQPSYPMPPQQQQPMFPSPLPMQPQQPSQGPGNYPTWRAQPARNLSPSQDMQQRPMYSQHHVPPVAGFNRPRRQLLQPWMLVVGALIMAAMAFVITRVLLS